MTSNVQLVPMFDPYTGQPLQPRFDPYTGLPLAGVSTVEAEDARIVHPTANGGQHDASWSELADRVKELEDWMDTVAERLDVHSNVTPVDLPTLSPNPPANPPSNGAADTSSIAATGGVTGPVDPAPGLLDSGSVPTNAPSETYPTSDPTNGPALTDERGEQPITSGPAFVPADETQPGVS